MSFGGITAGFPCGELPEKRTVHADLPRRQGPRLPWKSIPLRKKYGGKKGEKRMYRIAVCDDEAEVREQLCRMLSELLAEMDVPCRIVPYASAAELSQTLNSGEESFNLLCLDICMAGKNGMELAQEVRARDGRVDILFISSSDDYLREGYSVQPIQYLSKPVRRDEVETALRTALARVRSVRPLSIRAGNRTVVLNAEEVRYVESWEHGVLFHMEDEVRQFKLSLTETERLMPADQFCRCHNSFLVNMARIAEIGRQEVCLTDGTRVPVGRRFLREAQDRFVEYLNRTY